MNSKVKKQLQRAAVAVSSFLLAFSATAYVICNENAYQINGFLGIQTSEIHEAENTGVDTEYYKSKYNNVKAVKEAGLAAVEEVEAEGAVLLKNEKNALPLASDSRKISLFGTSSVNPLYAGTGSSGIDTSTAPTMKSSFENAGFDVNDELWDFYKSHPQTNKATYVSGGYAAGARGSFAINEVPWDDVATKSATFSEYGDAAVVNFARTAGEGADMPSSSGKTQADLYEDAESKTGKIENGNYLALSESEKQLLRGLKAEKDAGRIKKIIVLINTANAMQLGFLDDEQYGIDAALWIGTPGQSGLNAVADIIAGTVTPSGSLVDTYYTDNLKYNPSMSTFGDNIYENYGEYITDSRIAGGMNRYTVYQEGIYVGYRYTETRYEDSVLKQGNAGDFDYDEVVSYPFGYGLSYTTFSYSDFDVQESNDVYSITSSCLKSTISPVYSVNFR